MEMLGHVITRVTRLTHRPSQLPIPVIHPYCRFSAVVINTCSKLIAMSEKAPRDLSGDLPPVDAPLSGRTRSDDDFTDPPDTEFEDEIVDSYPTMEQLQSKLTMTIESIPVSGLSYRGRHG